MIKSPFHQFYQDSITRAKQRVSIIVAKVENVYYNGNQLSRKNKYFSETLL